MIPTGKPCAVVRPMNFYSESSRIATSGRLIRSPDITELTPEERETVDRMIASGDWREYGCVDNVTDILQALPLTTRSKMKVVVASHALNSLISYHGRNCSTYFFLLGQTPEGLVVFDPYTPSQSSTDAAVWIESVYAKEPLEYALKAKFCIPQFRFVDGSVFVQCLDKDELFYVTHPAYAISKNNECLRSDLWKQSYLLNLYETWQLFENKRSFQESMAFHQDAPVDSLTRLTPANLGELWAFFVDRIDTAHTHMTPVVEKNAAVTAKPPGCPAVPALNTLVRSPEIAELTPCERKTVDRIIEAGVWEPYGCQDNVSDILQALPIETSDKMKVVLVSHEGNGLIHYFGNSYSCHLFLLGKTADGLVVFDPAIPGKPSMDAASWIGSVFDRQSLEYPFKDKECYYVPQFRFFDGAVYSVYFEGQSLHEFVHPDYTARHNTGFIEQPLWRHSYMLNLYEVWQLFKGNHAFQESMGFHQDAPVMARRRLTPANIDELKAFFLQPSDTDPEIA